MKILEGMGTRMNELTMFGPEQEDWDVAWNRLRNRVAGNDVCLECGEEWQYMGSALIPIAGREASEKHYQHHFRHRCYPKHGERAYVTV